MAVPLTSIEPLHRVISQRPLGLISDIDGTLSPIAPTPEEAFVPPGVRRLLEELLARGVFVALISGRTLADARRMVGLDGLTYAGNHGLHLWVDGREEAAPEIAEYEAKARQVLADLRGLSHPGVRIEDKGPVIAVHYRLAPDEMAAWAAILAALQASAAAQEFRVTEGRKVVELRPPIAIDKGTALLRLARRWALRGLLCLGDDTTDIDMFKAAGELRGVEAASIAVEDKETTPEVLAQADFSVKGIKGVEWLLALICEQLRE